MAALISSIGSAAERPSSQKGPVPSRPRVRGFEWLAEEGLGDEGMMGVIHATTDLRVGRVGSRRPPESKETSMHSFQGANEGSASRLLG
jgi:hypothetical protein